MIGKAKAPAGILADRVVYEIEADLILRPPLRRAWQFIDDEELEQIRERWREFALAALKEMAGAV